MRRDRRMVGRTVSGVVFVFVLLGWTFVRMSSVALAGHGNTLSASPTSGPAGTGVTLSGTGWTPASANPPYVIFWDSAGGTQLGSFSPNANGAWSTAVTVPGGASPGGHQFIACEGFGTEFQDCLSTPFTVTGLPTNTAMPRNTPQPPTSTPRPAATAMPTTTPQPQVTLPAATPTLLFQPTLPPAPTPEGVCDDLGLGPEAVVLDFEESLAAQEARYGVSFERSGVVVTPLVAAHSGTHALRSPMSEFGSFRLPIQMRFSRPVRAVGAFVGLEEALYASGQITARLDVYGYRAGGTEVVFLGRDEVRFPAASTPIRYCLRLQVEEGETIVRAELEYRDSSGSTFEPRLVDDVTILYSEAEVPGDQAPRVVVFDPRDGAVVSGYQTFWARVQEDRSLRRMWYQIGDSAPVELGFWPFRMYGSRFTYETVAGFSLSGSGTHVVTFGAEDSAGQVGTDSITVIVPTPPPPVDIEAVAAEAVQVVQCLGDPGCGDNSVPLVANKPTLVRLYLRLRSGDVLEQPVRGQLCNVFWGLCVPSLNAVIPDADPDPVGSDRGDINTTLNFLMPTAWIPEDFGVSWLELEVTVNHRTRVEETDYSNNSQSLALRVVGARVMKVNFIPVSVAGVAAPLDERTNMADWLERVFPVTSLRIVSARSETALAVTSLSNGAGGGCGRDWGRMMSALDTRRRLDVNAGLVGPDVHYLGMVAQGVDTGGILGCGEMPGRTATSIITPGLRFGGQVAAQELAHNKGLRHAPGCGARGLDASYPVSGGTLDTWGVDVGRFQVYEPSSTFDYMGYCGSENDTWTSRYTYLNMMGLLPRAWLPANGGRLAAGVFHPGESHQYLVVAGMIYPNEVEVVTGPYRLVLREEDGTAPGPFSVEVLDGAGEVLYARDFRATPLSNDDTPDVGTFFLTLPVMEGTRAIRFLYQGVEITRLEATPGVPTVEILEPVGGEDWGSEGVRTIHWQAQDPEGDPLRFTVQASEDGERWITLALDLEDTDSFDLNVADLAGGSYFIRVLATDGFNMGEARTAAPVAVGRKPPTVGLTAPEDGAVFPRGEMVVFQGFATDLEDGEVPEEAYLWTSSIDGELGTGSTLWALELSPGEHEITMTVTDRDGMSAAARVHIAVLGTSGEEAEPEAAPAPPEDPSTGVTSTALLLILAGLGLLGLVGISLLVLAFRGPRRS